ncbi:hypothetical protein DFA_05225 [Cavenderia fasciculata]|uniref:Uncharacterized protein n=1 Tax=Cavenderia fasciculata TaxID=261658 RepID=F4PNP2_CACFS|nr:uncharacterized protein DFA_05225 [Cavenderia fasciculata]EGG23095.1 hypothetical protein DFA_05225 [Cavenderia fasciculata]|eukprot:XP_004360946.1 hypothetical protein DFA_05225 [Cavenderia fasciculata]
MQHTCFNNTHIMIALCSGVSGDLALSWHWHPGLSRLF